MNKLSVVRHLVSPPAAADAVSGDEFGLRDVISVLLNRKWLILGIVTVFTVISLVVVTRLTPRYTAQTLMVIDTQQRRGLDLESLASGVLTDRAAIQSEIDILRSRAIAGRVVDALGLINDPEFNPPPAEPGLVRRVLNRVMGWAGMGGTPPPAEAPAAASPAGVPSASAPPSAAVSPPAPTAAASPQTPPVAPGTAPAEAGADEARAGEAGTAEADAPQAAAGGPVAAAPSVAIPPPATEAEEQAQQRMRNAVIDRVIERIRVERVEQSYSITISFESVDPVKAAAIANQIVTQYLDYQIEVKLAATERVASLVNARLQTLRQQVVAADQALQARREQGGLVETGGQSVLEQQMADLVRQLTTTRSELSAAEAELQGVRSSAVIDTDRPNASPGSQILRDLRLQAAQLRAQEASLAQVLSARHPQLVNVRAQLATLQGQIERETGRAAASVQTRVNALRAQAATQQRQLEDLQGRVQVENRTQTGLRQLQSEAQVARTVYETFLNRYTQISSSLDFQLPDTRVIAEAQPPGLPSYPQKMPVMATAVLASLVLALLVVALLERLQNGFRSARAAERALGQPVLALVPEVARPLKRLFVPFPPADAILSGPTSQFAEAIRAVTTRIDLMAPDRPIRTLVVSSAMPAENKSLVAVSMARSWAQAGGRTVLVDGDLRRPSIGRVLGASQVAGLAELLAGEASLEEVVREDTATGLHYIPSGVSRTVPQHLLRSPRWRQLVADLAACYDHVIIDSPPVMAVSDATLLGAAADGVIFVARWRRTSREVVRAGIQQFLRVDIPILGVLVSRVNAVHYERVKYGDESSFHRQYRRYYTR